VVRIADIERGSIADELELRIGSRIVRINGDRVRDGIDFTFLSAEDELELEAVSPDGERRTLSIRRDPGRRLGIVPEPDTVRECANECVFCFIDGNPEDVRESLWLRDDDFRLSFTYGSYVTLTNLGPRGLERLVEQRLSPLYVSVHATEPDLRIRLLKNRRAGLILEQLRYLLEHGLEIHAQVVLCPEWNDGDHLDRTIEDLWALGEGVRSLSVVPVGLTKYNLHRPVRPLRPGEAARAVEQVDRARSRARGERGVGWCYAADELFLAAGRDLPDDRYYDDWALVENGVGAVNRFLGDFEEGLEAVPSLPGARIRILTGRSMGPILRARVREPLQRATGARVDVVEVENTFFGELVTVAGLLGGEDLLRAARTSDPLQERDLVLLPAEALNADDLFIDSVTLREFEEGVAPARVSTGYEITEALEPA